VPTRNVENPSPIAELADQGQSVWYDGLRRGLITSGELRRLIEGGVRGVTTNPAIYEKAVISTQDYDAELNRLLGQGLAASAVYEDLAVQDIQAAADLLRPAYQASSRRDGYVSLEVTPDVAHDAEATIAQARRLWKRLGRENAMIKVPGTPEGVEAFRALVAEGVNVNITLLFAQEVYQQVAEAYLGALEARLSGGQNVSQVASVASFFVSRIDTLVDELLVNQAGDRADPRELTRILALRGRVAVANAKLAYQRYRALLDTPRWKRLAAKGAMPQRLLWASTSTKNPQYRDVFYVEELIGPDTVDTVPPPTLEAFRDHGRVGPTLTEGVDEARQVLADLRAVGISFRMVTEELLADGVRLFAEPFERLLAAIERRRQSAGLDSSAPGP
jgi:transaldolase